MSVSTTVTASGMNNLNLTLNKYTTGDVITNDSGRPQTTIIGNLAGLKLVGAQNSVLGNSAMSDSVSAAANNVFGYAAAKALQGTDNVVMGNSALGKVVSANKNVYIGNNVAKNLKGNLNTLVGYNNTSTTDTIYKLDDAESDFSIYNASLGAQSTTIGLCNINIGVQNSVNAIDSILLGTNNGNYSNANSIVIGKNITNYGNNSFILRTSSNPLINSNDNYFNLNDIIFGESSNNLNVTSIKNDVISFVSSNTSLTIDSGGIQIIAANSRIQSGDVTNLSGKHSALNLDKTVTLSNAYSSLILTEQGSAIISGNTTASNDLLVLGKTTLCNNLITAGSATFLSNITASNNLLLIGNASLCNNLITAGTATFQSNIAASNDFLLLGNASLCNNLVTAGSATIQSNLLVTGSTSLCNNLVVKNLATFQNNISVLGLTSLCNNLIASGTATFQSNISVAGNTSLCNNLIASGTATFQSNIVGSNNLLILGTATLCNLSITNGATFNGDIQANSNLIVSGSTSLCNNLTTKGIAIFQSNITGSNDLTILGKTNLIGLTVQSNAFIGGDLSIEKSLNVKSNISTQGELYASGKIIGNSDLTIYGITNLTNKTYIGNDFTVQSNAFIGGDLSIQKSLEVIKDISTKGTLYVEGSSTLQSNLSVNGITSLCNNFITSGTATFQSNVAISNNLLLIGNASLCNNFVTAGTATFQSNLLLNGDASLCNNLITAGAALFQSNVTILGKLSLCNDIELYNNITISNNYKSIITGRGSFEFNQDLIISKNVTFSNAQLDGILRIGKDSSNPYIFTDIQESNLNEIPGTLMIDNNLYVGGQIFCNGVEWSAIDSAIMDNAIIHGIATFCNTQLEGILKIGKESSNPYIFSDIQEANLNEVQGTLMIDNNLYVGGQIFCNGIEWSAIDSAVMDSAVFHGKTTFCNAHVDGILKIGTQTDQPYVFTDIQESNLNEVQGTLMIDHNLYVGGQIFCNGIEWSAIDSAFMDSAVFCGTTTFCNTRIDGVLKIGTHPDQPYVFTDIQEANLNEVQGTLMIDHNLYVGGQIFCNGIEWSAIDSAFMDSAVLCGTTTFCNARIDGILKIGTHSNQPYVFTDIQEANLNEVQGTLMIDNNLYVGGQIFCNGIEWSAIDSAIMDSAIFYGNTTFCNAQIDGVLKIGGNCGCSFSLSNIHDPEINEIEGTLIIDNNLYVNGKILCNGIEWSAIDSAVLQDTVIYGTTTFCNAIFQGALQIGASKDCGCTFSLSNIHDKEINEIEGTLIVDNNLYVNGKILCNGIEWSTIDSMLMEDAIVYGTMTLCNANIEGALTIGSLSNYINYSNIPNAQDITGNLIVSEDLYVSGRLFCNGFMMSAANIFESKVESLSVTSNIKLMGDDCGCNETNEKWSIQLESGGADLVFKSVNNTRVVFTDDFTPALLNFTGHHLVTMKSFIRGDISEYIGKIVISTGKYCNLQNKAFIEIDDAIPIVELSKRKNDRRVFGVISDIEKADENRSYKIGNLKFVQDKEELDIKVKVNSVGEGGIWVVNYNGNFKNGDLITTCVIPGYGSKQKHYAIASHTIAKITCDCNFNLDSDVYECKEFYYKDKKYKKAFVGCIYKC